MEGPATTTPRRKRKRLYIIFAVVAFLVLVRLALPHVLLHVANERLANMEGYRGAIEDIDLALIRGAYQIKGFHLDKVDDTGQAPVPFLAAALIDLSVEWRALFRGSLVSEIEVDRPMVRFTKDKTEPGQVQADTASLADLLNDFMPLSINRLVVRDGSIEYKDEGASPVVHLALSRVEATAENLTTVVDANKLLPASVTASAGIYGGELSFQMGLDVLADDPLFEMELEVEDMDLTQLNDFFEAYGNFDVSSGTMSMYSEMATKEQAFKGYLKPLIFDFKALGREDRGKPFFRQVWEGLVHVGGLVLTNPRKGQLGTQINMEGRLDEPGTSTLEIVVFALRNAFIQALEPGVEGIVDLTTLGGERKDDDRSLLQRIFSKDEE
jgi:hypothetical protein